jgi:Tfp pilus assembly protein PilN
MEDPNQKLGEHIPTSQPLSGTLKMFDINILPQRYRRRRPRLIAILPWLIFILLLGALYQTGLMAMQAQAGFQQKQIELSEIQDTLENYMAAANEKEALQAEVDARKEARDLILESYQGLEIQGSNWSNLLHTLERTIPSGIQLSLLYQVENEIRLEGEAESYDFVLEFLDALELREELSEVYIGSVTQVEDEDGEPPVIISEDGETVVIPDRYTFVINAIAVEEDLR